MSRSWSRWHTKIFPQPSSSPFLPLSCSMVCIFQAVNCPHLRRQYMFRECFSCICIGFSEFNKPAMCRISHCHFFSIMLFVLPFRTEHSTYFILSKVCHFVGRLKHKVFFASLIALFACLAHLNWSHIAGLLEEIAFFSRKSREKCFYFFLGVSSHHKRNWRQFT